MTGDDRPRSDGDETLLPSDEEQEPDWAEQIRRLRRHRGPRLEERLADDDTDRERPLPDL